MLALRIGQAVTCPYEPDGGTREGPRSNRCRDDHFPGIHSWIDRMFHIEVRWSHHKKVPTDGNTSHASSRLSIGFSGSGRHGPYAMDRFVRSTGSFSTVGYLSGFPAKSTDQSRNAVSLGHVG